MHIDSTCDPSSEFASKCNDMSPKNLSLEEKKYLLAVRDGDLANVKKYVPATATATAVAFSL